MTYALSSQQVSWSDVHAFVLPKLIKVGDWPMLGSPAWCELSDRDPVKWAAVLDGGQHWALRVEHFQQVECAASHDISAAENWAGIAHALAQRDAFLAARGEPAEHFTARPWMDRRASR